MTSGRRCQPRRYYLHFRRGFPARSGAPPQLILHKPVVQSSELKPPPFTAHRSASNCIDGRRHIACRTNQQKDPWLSIAVSDVGVSVDTVQIYNRNEARYMPLLSRHQIWVGTSFGQYGPPAQLCADWTAPPSMGPFDYDCNGMLGTHVTVLLPGADRELILDEVS